VVAMLLSLALYLKAMIKIIEMLMQTDSTLMKILFLKSGIILMKELALEPSQRTTLNKF
jgi:hypothetical protein